MCRRWASRTRRGRRRPARRVQQQPEHTQEGHDDDACRGVGLVAVVDHHHDDRGLHHHVDVEHLDGCTHITASPGQGQGAAGTITGVITVTNTRSARARRRLPQSRSSPGAGTTHHDDGQRAVGHDLECEPMRRRPR